MTCTIYILTPYTFSIDYGIEGNIKGTITSNGDIKYTELTETGADVLDENRDFWDEVLNKMVLYYNIAYDVKY